MMTVQEIGARALQAKMAEWHGAGPADREAADYMDAVVAALRAAGWVMVPREPTREMWASSANALVKGRRASPWRTIDSDPPPPHDQDVLVYAPAPDPEKWDQSVCDLPAIQRVTRWHPDAGFCVCTIREVTHYKLLGPGPEQEAT